MWNATTLLLNRVHKRFLSEETCYKLRLASNLRLKVAYYAVADTRICPKTLALSNLSFPRGLNRRCHRRRSRKPYISGIGGRGGG